MANESNLIRVKLVAQVDKYDENGNYQETVTSVDYQDMDKDDYEILRIQNKLGSNQSLTIEEEIFYEKMKAEGRLFGR